MKQQEEKKKNARHALKHVKPVASVTVIQSIWTHFRWNEYAVNWMKQKRQENAEDFDEQQIRNMMNIGNRVIKNLVAAHWLRVREQMH